MGHRLRRGARSGIFNCARALLGTLLLSVLAVSHIETLQHELETLKATRNQTPHHITVDALPEQARCVLRALYTTEADLVPDPDARTLTVRLHHSANAAIDQVIEKLCEELNATETIKRPSSDDITKPKGGKKTRGPDEEGNPIGGQPGHPKHNRALYPSEAISYTHEHESMNCPLYGAHDILWVEDLPARVVQQTEIKEVVVTRGEHRAYADWCEACGQIHHADFPPQVRKEGLFKARLTALVAYLKNLCHASFLTIRKFLRDVLGVPVSRGYLAKIIQKVSQSLERPYEELLAHMPLEAYSECG